MARRYLAILITTLATILVASAALADDRRTHTIKMKASGGRLEIEVPKDWGNKPEVTQGDNATLIGFEPAGTRRDPIFRVTILAGVPGEPIDAAIVRSSAERLRDEFRDTALEDAITVHDIAGEKNMISYFTLTDKEIKPREYQYLTAAVVSDGTMAATFWFFTNDGAPDYAADAMHLMETLRYIPKEEKKKR
ncbi:MAG: hypothetical protein AAFN50_02285 [Pseudomonadota bacterium]